VICHLLLVILNYHHCFIMAIGEHCELEEHEGHHVLQCAWSRVKRVLTDYDFNLMPPKEQVPLLLQIIINNVFC